MACIERVPLAAEIGVEPGREIHRRVRPGHADIAEIAAAIACRDVDAAAQGDRQVGEIPAHPLALLIGIPRRLGRPGEMIAELDMIMGEFDNRLDPFPARLDMAEQ